VFDELPDLPHLPELPHRGPGADLIGRGALFLTDLHIDLQPAGWRLINRPGVDERRGRDLLERDLDAFEAVAGDYAGPVKIQVAGPWTLAANLELTRGDKALSDQGAVRDIAEALADGVASHVADLRRRVPGASVLVALDEPSMPAVLAGRVKTASGFSVLPQPESDVAEQRLATVLRGSGAPAGVHCCAVNPPITLARKAGAAFVSMDFTLALSTATLDEFGEAVEAGIGVIAGLVGTGPGGGKLSDPGHTVEPILSLWRRLGLAADQLREVAVSPTCGLAGASPQAARGAMKRCREAARRLAEADL
jgi:methionine synthase II (cobalamin-independent)